MKDDNCYYDVLIKLEEFYKRKHKAKFINSGNNVFKVIQKLVKDELDGKISNFFNRTITFDNWNDKLVYWRGIHYSWLTYCKNNLLE